jgi:hypothetical protein
MDAVGKLANFTANQPALPTIVFTEIADADVARPFDILFSPTVKLQSA